MQEFTFEGLGVAFGEFRIKISHGFRTAHTYTTERSNFLVRITLDGVTGEAEAGLPPKKPACYLADVEDCNQCMALLKGALSGKEHKTSPSPLEMGEYFAAFRKDGAHPQLPRILQEDRKSVV